MNPIRKRLLAFFALLVILAAGAFLRLSYLRWDEFTYMHPDERFLIWVTADMRPVDSVRAFFDTPVSTLNPHNVGHTFFVYGTFPLFLTRYAAEWLHSGPLGWQEIALTGRALSALFDLGTVLLVYLTAAALYRRRTALLAAALYALSVLPIQLSHFYKEDTFLNFFAMLAVYCAALVVQERRSGGERPAEWKRAVGLSAVFGVALGLAAASKLNAAPVAVVLPLAFGARLLRLPAAQRERAAARYAAYVALAAVISLLVFRVAQPYAFSGPGFFGLRPNRAWVENIIEQRNQAAGDVDFPPALQWARRSHLFGWYNLTAWGLGWPLGLLAWAGFLWAGWRIWRGERRLLPLWGWAALYFAWQSAQFNPTMRYFLPLYPLLAIFAAAAPAAAPRKWRRAAGMLALLVLGATAAYALAFRSVYAQGFTRANASRWIYQHIPGPVNIPIELPGTEETYNQPLSLPYDFILRPDAPLHTQFTARRSGRVRSIPLGRVFNTASLPQARTFRLMISLTPDGAQVLAAGDVTLHPQESGSPATLTLDRALPVNSGETLYLSLLPLEGLWPDGLQGNLDLEIQTPAETATVSLDVARFAQASEPLPYTFSLDGTMQQAALRAVLPPAPPPQPKTLTLTLARNPDGSGALASASLTDTFAQPLAADGSAFTFVLPAPVPVEAGETYYLTLSVQGTDAALTLQGAALANEGDWDDGLPLRMDGYDGFGGIYPRDLNFNMYWDDNPDKLARFTRILDQADYIAISSSRQWATLPRLPERFPMTTRYYRALLGCPEERSIEWCYNVAQVGDFRGGLGFELVHVEASPPTLGAWRINDQFAEEAFTVYDHPKVFIFRKTAEYDPQRVRALLGSVDFSRVVRVTPKKAAPHPMDLLLPAPRLAVQQAGGTWRTLFDVHAPLNRWRGLGTAAWYLSLFLLGLAAYPFTRLALHSLPDKGYPLARISGLLLLAWGVWLPASYTVPFERPLIGAVLALIVLAGAALAWAQRTGLRAEWQARRGYFLRVEMLALAAFLLVLFLRWGNPDLWHPWKGGEKPMDFSYFNAVLKSTTFPPYDPWYAGGYINYYYYGFVLAGVLVKFLGLVPAFAYNLLIPTLFMLIVLGAFSLGVNLTAWGRRNRLSPAETAPLRLPLAGGMLAALALAVMGNLGTARMIWRGYQMLAAPSATNEAIAGLSLLTRLWWGLQGMLRSLAGASLPYGIADWYWLPSRAIPPLGDVEPITEFPAFTVIYADLHAHLIALPVTLLALAFALAVVYALSRGQRPPLAGVFLGALAIGALKPTNTWDWPTYLALSLLALGWAAFAPRVAAAGPSEGEAAARTGRRLAPLLLFLALVSTLYRPYDLWFGSGYNKVDWWFGPKTPLSAYFVHWGGFLFVLVSWLAWETLRWMARTPLSALGRLRPYRNLITGTLAAFGGLMLLLGLPLPGTEIPPLRDAVHVAWVVIPLGVWVLALLFNPHLNAPRRAVLFLTGAALALTLLVEVIVLRGDIGRMNTVFKFYYQGWTLLGLSAAAALWWLFQEALPHWRGAGALLWQGALALLAASMLLYPLMGGAAKFKDRMAAEAPHTLDGMAYMQYAEYYDQGGPYPLKPDYAAIRWLQENVDGSPVIVEGNTPEYRWGTRITMYTGLPGVVGWNWHQRQQRGGVIPADWVTSRIGEVTFFYSTEDAQAAADFLRKYGARYFVLGNLERAYYPASGLGKFAAYDGVLWRAVFRSGDTIVYEVLR